MSTYIRIRLCTFYCICDTIRSVSNLTSKSSSTTMVKDLTLFNRLPESEQQAILEKLEAEMKEFEKKEAENKAA